MDGGETGKYCPVQPQETRGVNCSDFVATEVDYVNIMQYIFEATNEVYNITPIRWDETEKSPFFNIISSNATRQVWYDDPQSLTAKYEYAKSMGLRGVGPFQFDDLVSDYSVGETQRAQAMWSAFDAFFL